MRNQRASHVKVSPTAIECPSRYRSTRGDTGSWGEFVVEGMHANIGLSVPHGFHGQE